MSIYDLLDDLSKNAASVSLEIQKKRCSLARETGRDSFSQGAMEFSHLEALLKGIEAALTEIKKHISADTNLPTSAKRSEGEDINVPTKLPAWCKVGQWVITEDGKILKIDCITGHLVSVRSPNGLAYCTSTPDLTFKPVRFRPYTFEEAKGLLGKVIESFSWSGRNKNLITITEVSEREDGCHVNGYSHTYWSNRNATIDGVPIGIPKVDEEAMKEVE